MKAINGNNKLARAYVGMADFFIKANDKKQALEIITKGVINNPDSKALKRMYKELGGAMPYPAPAEPIAEMPGKKPDEVVANVPATVAEPPHAQDKVEKKEATQATANVSVEERGEIGSPTNPWCRFCTDTPAAPAALNPATPGAIPRAAP